MAEKLIDKHSHNRFSPLVIGLAMVSVIGGAAGQLFMKVGMGQVGEVGLLAGHDFAEIVAVIWPEPVLWVGLGLFCYGTAMVVWLVVLSRLDLSLAYPLLSLGYVLVYGGAVLWERIGETPTTMRTAGVALIVVGVMLTTSRMPEKTQDDLLTEEPAPPPM